jgi:hypothetical protein
MTLILDGTNGLSDVDGSAATPAIRGTDANTGIFFPAADTIAFSEGGAEAMRIDSSGNVGIGVTPGTWQSGFKALQINAQASVAAGGATAYLSCNNRINAGNFYIGTGTAMQYEQFGGAHTWSSAPSGTAGNAITFTQVLAVNKDTSLALQGATSQSGTGITFPATQSASSNANTLDDYEEGTFTPILADSASSSNAATMTTQEGFYTKVGNTVTIQIQIVWSSKGSMGAGNNTRIYGIPFNAKSNTSGYYWPALITMSSGNTGFVAGQEGGGTAITLALVNAPTSELSTSYVSASGRLLIQYTYLTA